MKTQEATQKQGVQVHKTNETVVTNVTTNEGKGNAKKQETAKKHESMEDLGLRLFKEKASEKAIESAFVKAYKAKNIEDKAFIEKRVKIYMKIAEKHASVKK